MSGCIGIIGAGSFGSALGKILQNNDNEVLFYVRTPRDLSNSTTSLKLFFETCEIVFIVIPVESIIQLLDSIKTFISPKHVLIHCIKGLVSKDEKNINRGSIFTISEFIKNELHHDNVACLSGPNLADEIKNLQLTSVVIASQKEKVRTKIKCLLENRKFVVYESKDVIGIELCGVLKNIIALASGILNGLGEGDNAKSLLMTLGLKEMIKITKIFTNIEEETFYSVAGIGDLIATCSSNLSRNFTVGNRVAKGETLEKILSEGITAEGIKTTAIINSLALEKNIKFPITQSVFKILFEKADPNILISALSC